MDPQVAAGIAAAFIIIKCGQKKEKMVEERIFERR
jgi:hypothetical protein